MTSMRRWLTSELKDVPGAARMAREWHELLHPPDSESERLLLALQRRYGMLPRDLIFKHPGDRSSENDTKSREGRTLAARTMLDHDMVIRILHMRFVENKTPAQILSEIEPQVGKKKGAILSSFYSRVLADEGQEILGIKEHKSWSFPQYVKAASLFLNNESVDYKTVSKAIDRSEGSTRTGLYIMGKRLIEMRPEYKDLAPLAAFILEYGPKHLFHGNESPRAVAERIYKLHSRDESAPAAHMHTKRRVEKS